MLIRCGWHLHRNNLALLDPTLVVEGGRVLALKLADDLGFSDIGFSGSISSSIRADAPNQCHFDRRTCLIRRRL